MARSSVRVFLRSVTVLLVLLASLMVSGCGLLPKKEAATNATMPPGGMTAVIPVPKGLAVPSGENSWYLVAALKATGKSVVEVVEIDIKALETSITFESVPVGIFTFTAQIVQAAVKPVDLSVRPAYEGSKMVQILSSDPIKLEVTLMPKPGTVAWGVDVAALITMYGTPRTVAVKYGAVGDALNKTLSLIQSRTQPTKWTATINLEPGVYQAYLEYTGTSRTPFMSDTILLTVEPGQSYEPFSESKESITPDIDVNTPPSAPQDFKTALDNKNNADATDDVLNLTWKASAEDPILGDSGVESNDFGYIISKRLFLADARWEPVGIGTYVTKSDFLLPQTDKTWKFVTDLPAVGIRVEYMLTPFRNVTIDGVVTVLKGTSVKVQYPATQS